MKYLYLSYLFYCAASKYSYDIFLLYLYNIHITTFRDHIPTSHRPSVKGDSLRITDVTVCWEIMVLYLIALLPRIPFIFKLFNPCLKYPMPKHLVSYVFLPFPSDLLVIISFQFLGLWMRFCVSQSEFLHFFRQLPLHPINPWNFDILYPPSPSQSLAKSTFSITLLYSSPLLSVCQCVCFCLSVSAYIICGCICFYSISFTHTVPTQICLLISLHRCLVDNNIPNK